MTDEREVAEFMIKAQNLTKKFEEFTALENITCTIADGCIYGMVGSNGAGKSTFLRIIALPRGRRLGYHRRRDGLG